MLVTKTSVITGKENTIDLPITQEQLQQWQLGGLVQDVFPDLDVNQREFLISGTTQEEWEETFGEGLKIGEFSYD
jgi:hypothetical protein